MGYRDALSVQQRSWRYHTPWQGSNYVPWKGRSDERLRSFPIGKYANQNSHGALLLVLEWHPEDPPCSVVSDLLEVQGDQRQGGQGPNGATVFFMHITGTHGVPVRLLRQHIKLPTTCRFIVKPRCKCKYTRLPLSCASMYSVLLNYWCSDVSSGEQCINQATWRVYNALIRWLMHKLRVYQKQFILLHI